MHSKGRDGYGRTCAIARAFEPNAREASRMVREILAHWPDDYDANSLMGAILADLDEFDESIMYLDRAIQINPSDSLAYGHKASTLRFKGDLGEAEVCARKELALGDPGYETYYLAYDSLYEILQEQGRLDEAQQVLKDGIEATGSDFLREQLAALEAPKQADAQSWSGGYSFTSCGGPRDQG